jgi:hypothetical protein
MEKPKQNNEQFETVTLNELEMSREFVIANDQNILIGPDNQLFLKKGTVITIGRARSGGPSIHFENGCYITVAPGSETTKIEVEK